MANVKFAYGSKTSLSTSTSGFDDGCIYFGTSAKKIWLRQGSSVYTFDGNNTNNIPGYTLSSGGTSTTYGWCHIQNIPKYSDGTTYTSGQANSWWHLWGQNNCPTSTLWEESYDWYDFDYAINMHTSRPPLSSAKEIIVAVDVYQLARAMNSGTTPTSVSNAFPLTEKIVMSVHRTQYYPYPVQGPDDYSYYGGNDMGAMFYGSYSFDGYHNSSSSSYGMSTTIGRVDLWLCQNGTNAITASVRAVELKGASEKFTGSSTTATSAQYQYDGGYGYSSYKPDMERHIYPLDIRYI